MKHGAFISQRNSQCSIYESGLMVKNIIEKSNDYTLDFIETTPELDDVSPDFNSKYDFYLINWHPTTLPISVQKINAMGGKKFSVIFETTPETCFVYMPESWFDAHMVIDPTKQREGSVYPFPRPLETVSNLKPLLREDKIVIGSFGFICPTGPALDYKRFYEVVENANKIGNCIVRFNFPVGTYTGIPQSMLAEYGDTLKRLANSTVDVQVTHTYTPKEDLIQWCSENTINVFPYYRNLSGLSAVTDQAIVANRPIAITECPTFRHMHKYISHYPAQSYLELIESTPVGIKRMQEDWSPDNFRKAFNNLLVEYAIL